MSRHDIATLLIGAAFYAAGIWTVLMWPRTRQQDRRGQQTVISAVIPPRPKTPPFPPPPASGAHPLMWPRARLDPRHKETDHA